MGVSTHEKKVTSAAAPATLSKAVVRDANNRIPKTVPKAGKEVEILKGDGRAGTIKKITSTDGKYVKHKTDSIGRYSLIDVKKISHETKLVAAPGGGTLVKVTTRSYTSHTRLEMASSKKRGPGKEKKRPPAC